MENTVKTLNIDDTCRTNLTAEAFSVDFSACEDKRIGSKAERDIL